MGPCQLTERDRKSHIQEDSACEEPLHECDEGRRPLPPVPHLSFSFCLFPSSPFSPPFFPSCCLTLFLKSGESEGSCPLFVCVLIEPTCSLSMGPTTGSLRNSQLTDLACVSTHPRRRSRERARILEISSSPSLTILACSPEVHQVPT